LEFQNAIRLNRSDAEPYYQLGPAYIGSRQLHAAFDALTKATQLNPNHTPAQVKLAELTAATGDQQLIERARTSMEEILRKSPSDADALDALAMTQFRLGDWQDARQALALAVEHFPNHLKSSIALARIETFRGNAAKAEEILTNAAAQSPQLREPKLVLADFYLSSRRGAEAEQQFRSVLQSEPHNSLALLGLAAAQVEQGQLQEAEQSYRQVSLLADPQYKHVYPSYLVTQGRYSEAISQFEQLAGAAPGDRQVRNRLVVACVLANRTSQAEQILTKSLQANPKDMDALTLYAVLLLNAGKYNDAEQRLLRALAIRRDSDVVHSLLSRVHREAGRTLQQRQELSEALRINPRLAQARLDLAESLMQDNSAKAALEVLDAVPDEQRQTLPWITGRNWALLSLDELAELDKGVKLGLVKDRTPDLLLQNGLLKMRAKDYAGARAAFDEGLQRSPEDPRLLWVIAQTQVLEGHAALALKNLQAYADKRPHSARVQLLLAQWLSKTGDRTSARRALLAAKAADPNFAETDFQLAQLDANEGRIDEARQGFVLLLDRGGYRFSAQLWLANIEDRARNYPAAMEGYRRVLAMNPRNLVALNNLAYLLATQTNQLDEALQDAQQARELAPTNTDVEGTLGWVLFRKGIYDSAAGYLKEASRKDGSDTGESAIVRRYHLGMVYMKTGDLNLGTSTLTSALQMNPRLPEAEAALELLRSRGAQ
jgi:tetratricopeptide (TPR) repeat protein